MLLIIIGLILLLVFGVAGFTAHLFWVIGGIVLLAWLLTGFGKGGRRSRRWFH